MDKPPQIILPHIEKNPERAPALEEVLSILRRITTKEYKEVRKRIDEKGLYLLDVTVPGASANEITEYSYMRKGQYKEGKSATTGIQVYYYKDGQPMGGTTVADFIDGEWILTSE